MFLPSLQSPLGATKTKSPFMGSKCFSRANEELVKRGWKPIDWRVDGALESNDSKRPKNEVPESTTNEESEGEQSGDFDV